MEKVNTNADPKTPRGASRYTLTLSNGKTKIHIAVWQAAIGGFCAMALNGSDGRRFRGETHEAAMEALVNYFEKA
jgi:hypothetical protein